MRTAEEQRVVDQEHVRLLGIFFYISGGFSALFGLFPLFYVVVGAAMAVGLPTSVDAPPEGEAVARSMGVLFAGMGLAGFLVGQSFAGLKFLAGYWLSRRRKRISCLVIAGVICIGFPYSTILGVITMIVLLRDSVRQLFDEADRERTKEIAA